MDGVTVALKIDVATFSGLRYGTPEILRILKAAGIKATFYFALGPDNSGKAIRRFFLRSGALRNALVGPWRYDLRTMLYGILLPPPIMGRKLAATIVSARRDGHEIGIHCWDHAKWYDLLPYLPKSVTAMELGRAAALFQEITGSRALTTAAPGCVVSVDSLEIQDAMHLSHCSDTRGCTPFYPLLDGRRFSTLQIPTTMPTLDELIRTGTRAPKAIIDKYLSKLSPGLHVHTIQPELEGGRFSPLLVELIARMQGMGVRFETLADVAAVFARRAIQSEIRFASIPGGAGKAAVQDLDHHRIH